jgi:hypothetical protein
VLQKCNLWRRSDPVAQVGGLGRPGDSQIYAPFALSRYSTSTQGTGPGRGSTIYWLMSTSNPCEVTVMRSTLHVEAP